VDDDLPVQRGVLGVAEDEVAERAAAETHDGDRRVLHLDGRVVYVGPVARHLLNLAEIPEQEIQHVRGLVDEHAAALVLP
jgi:hypothetical protein